MEATQVEAILQQNKEGLQSPVAKIAAAFLVPAPPTSFVLGHALGLLAIQSYFD
jgi:hypothetical protein